MYQTLEHTSPSRRSGYSKAHLLAFVVNSLEIMVVAFSSRRIVDRWVCGLESALSCLTTDWTGWSRREGEPFHTFNTYVFSAHSMPRNWANVGISPGLTYSSLIFPNLLHWTWKKAFILTPQRHWGTPDYGLANWAGGHVKQIRYPHKSQHLVTLSFAPSPRNAVRFIHMNTECWASSKVGVASFVTQY